MSKYEIREGNGNDGELIVGQIEADDAVKAIINSHRMGMIRSPRDVRITQDTNGDSVRACVVSLVDPIVGDSARWCASARKIW